MTKMLASVKNIEEALMVLGAGVDIIDLKEPEHGALGALDTHVVEDIVKAIDKRCLVSATIGDLPMQPDVIFFATKVMAGTGVDYIKIGFFPDGDWGGTISKLSVLTDQHNLIAVLFADAKPDLTVVQALKAAGFKGVMLDTMDKSKGHLTKMLDGKTIAAFVKKARALSLLTGLAGSLRESDIPGLLAYRPHYLGFRGALCHAGQRIKRLNKGSVLAVKQAIKEPKKKS